MAELTEQIVYGEATRAITEQQNALDGLRSRTGVLLAAAAIVTSFLGGEALREPNGLDRLEWAGVGSFAAVAALSLIILVPWSRWRFAASASTLIADHIDIEERNTPKQLYRFLAERLDDWHNKNAWKLGVMHAAFTLAAAALGTEIVIWLLKLGRG